MINLKVVNPVFHPRGAWRIIGPESHPKAFLRHLEPDGILRQSSSIGGQCSKSACAVHRLSIWGAVRCIWDSGQSYRCCKGENAASQIDALSSQKLRYMAPRTFFHLLLPIAPNFYVYNAAIIFILRWFPVYQNPSVFGKVLNFICFYCDKVCWITRWSQILSHNCLDKDKWSLQFIQTHVSPSLTVLAGLDFTKHLFLLIRLFSALGGAHRDQCILAV